MDVATKKIYEAKKRSGQPEDKLSNMIAPSCTSIALLGQLLLLSKNRDFRLVEKEKQVKHIKHPESFRACLLQLTHGSWDAFNMAEQNMDRVLRNVEEMPAIFDSVTEILVDGEADDVVDLLPAELESLSSRATSCLKFTKQCEDAFENVMDLIEEISELCGSKDLSLKDKHAEMITKKQILENQKTKLEQDRKEFEKEKASLAEAMKEAQKIYDAALADLPGNGILAIGMVNELVSQVPSVVSMLAPTKLWHKVCGAVSSVFSQSNKPDNLVGTAPNQDQDKQSDPARSSACQALIETKKKKAELAEKHFFEQQARYDKVRNTQIENANEMLEVVNRFANLEISNLSVTEMRETLVAGMALFAQIRKQWGHLTRYFQSLANMVNENMNTELKEFGKLADDLKGKSMSMLKQKSLLRISDKAKQSIAETQYLAGFYVDISQRYLMPNLNYVFEIEAKSSQRSESETKRALMNVETSCKKTIDEITNLANQRSGLKMLKGN